MDQLSNVKVLFSNVNSKDSLSDKYQVTVLLDEDTAADAEAAGISVKTKEYEGDTQFQATFKSRYRPKVVGVDGKTPFDLEGGELGRGSLVNIGYTTRDWQAAGKSGVAKDLAGVQVLKAEGVGGSMFSDASEALGEDVAM